MEETPPKAKQPSTWIQAKLQDWKWENILLASDYTLVCQEKNLDWLVGVGKGMKMAAQEKGGGGEAGVFCPRWIYIADMLGKINATRTLIMC